MTPIAISPEDRPVTSDEPSLDHEILEAVRNVRAGNAQAFAVIIERFQVSITTLSAVILRDRQAGEELSQDVFVRAYQRLETFDARQPMKPWLVKIAYRLAQARFRTQAREMAHRTALAENYRKEQSPPDPTDALAADQRAEALWQAVETLPVAQRTAVVLYYREGLKIQQVAEAMDVSPGTVKTHLFRARSQIRDVLTQKGWEELSR
jgi:RNA polymerase sigma-70 factor (ECF subfamily)